MHDRETLYRFLYDNCDVNGIISKKQGVIAQEFGISYQALSDTMREFIDMGLIDKNGHKFLVVYDPDKVPWDKFKQLRKRYMKAKAQSGA